MTPHSTITVTRQGNLLPCLIDSCDLPLVAARRWYVARNGYAMTTVTHRGTETKELMHRRIMGLAKGDGLEVDHLNGNRLDNRRSNLRIVTHAEQCQNVRGKGSASVYRGVTFDKRRSLWRARLTVHGKEYWLGYFTDELAAAEAAREARVKMMTHAIGGLTR